MLHWQLINLMELQFAESIGRIPFKIVPVGEGKNGSVLMHLENSTINGSIADITFDTGAGVNMISDSLARHFNLIPIDGYVTAAGVGQRTGQYAIAKEIKIGNITVSDVPFVIIDFKTGNDKADQFTHHFSIILGSELMLQLKDVTLDFTNKEITVPSTAPERSDVAPNICFGEGMTLNCCGRVLNNPIMMNIDTGDAAYGTLGVSFSFDANANTGIKQVCKSMGIPQEDWYCCYTFRHTWGTIAQKRLRSHDGGSRFCDEPLTASTRK